MINTIQTIKDLNAFVDNARVRSPDKIISSLVDEKVVISFEMAKLIVKHHKSALS